MLQFLDSFADCFKTNSPNNTLLASRYVSGLLSKTQRKNMERMDERLGDDEALGEDIYQATQQFISSSRWDYDAVYRQLCVRADQRLGGSVDSVLVIDESGNTKKGRGSVGVGQQYNGRLGKRQLIRCAHPYGAARSSPSSPFGRLPSRSLRRAQLWNAGHHRRGAAFSARGLDQ